MFIYCICTQYLVGASSALITASIRRDMEVISLWHCWGGVKTRFLWQWPSAHLHFFGLLFLIFLLTIPHRFSMFSSGEFAGQSSTPTPWSFNQLSVNMLGYSTLWTASLAMNVCVLSSLWRVSMIVFWTTVRSAVFPMIVWPSEPNWENILKAQETFAGV